MDSRGPSSWVTIHCFSRHSSNELDHKWSNGDLKDYFDMECEIWNSGLSLCGIQLSSSANVLITQKFIKRRQTSPTGSNFTKGDLTWYSLWSESGEIVLPNCSRILHSSWGEIPPPHHGWLDSILLVQICSHTWYFCLCPLYSSVVVLLGQVPQPIPETSQKIICLYGRFYFFFTCL